MPYNYRQLDSHASATPKSGTSTSTYPSKKLKKQNDDGEKRIRRGDNAKARREQNQRDNSYYVKENFDYGDIGGTNHYVRNVGGAGYLGTHPKAIRDTAEMRASKSDKQAAKSKNRKSDKKAR